MRGSHGGARAVHGFAFSGGNRAPARPPCS